MSYLDIYKKRLNRYGLDYQSRVQTEREHLFDLYLQKTTERIDFTYNGESIPAALGRYKQDETRTLAYLKVKVDREFDNGTLLQLPNDDDELEWWMVYYKEFIESTGYNKFTVLRMTHYLTWYGKDSTEVFHSWAYLFAPENDVIRDKVYSSRSSSDVLYGEADETSSIIMPANDNIKRDRFMKMSLSDTSPLTYMNQGFRITGFDLVSTPGVEYVSINPVYNYDLTPAPARPSVITDEDKYYWFDGGQY